MSTEDVSWWDLGFRIDRLEKLGEAASRARRRGPVDRLDTFGELRPRDRQLGCESLGAGCLDEANEIGEEETWISSLNPNVRRIFR